MRLSNFTNKRLGGFVALTLIAGTVSPALAQSEAESDLQESPREVVLESEGMRVTTAGEWVYYERSTVLPNSHLREVHGDSGKQGDATDSLAFSENLRSPLCIFSDERAMPETNIAKGSVFISRQIALNLSKCIIVVEEALVGPEDFARLGLDDEADTKNEEAYEEASMESGGLAPSASTKTRTFETRYEDPPTLDTSRARVHLSWNYTSSCVLSSWNHSTNYYWLSSTGWSKQSSWTASSRNCSEARTWSYSKYKNSIFCKGLIGFLGFPYTLAWALLQPTTYNRYNTTKLIGKKGGGASTSYNSSKWGGCDSLLSHSTVYYYYYKS